jgi:hypothetical protein
MKYVVAALALSQASAFSIGGQSTSTRATTRLAAEYEPLEGESKINLKVSWPG